MFWTQPPSCGRWDGTRLTKSRQQSAGGTPLKKTTSRLIWKRWWRSWRTSATRRAQDSEAELDETRKTLRDAELTIAELRGRLAGRLDQEKASDAPKGRRKTVKQGSKPETDEDDDQPDMFPDSHKTPDDPEPIAAE